MPPAAAVATVGYEHRFGTDVKHLLSIALVLANCGCTVMTVAGAAVGVAATAVGVAADVAVGTAKVVGKGAVAAGSAVAGAVAGDSDDEESAGIVIVDRVRPAPPSADAPPQAPR